MELANLRDKRNAEVIQAAEIADPYAYVDVLEQPRQHRYLAGRERIHPYMCIARPISMYIRATIARNRIYVLENQYR